MVTALLPAIFFFSGCAALVFENLWFYQAGITFGNSIWASSLVLAGFMGGLALGNALATRLRPGGFRAIRTYGLLEAAVGLFGIAPSKAVLKLSLAPGVQIKAPPTDGSQHMTTLIVASRFANVPPTF